MMRPAMMFAALALTAGLAAAQVCNPVCANQPAACCSGVQSDTFLAEECTGTTSDLIHFVLPGTGTGWVDLREPATFDVSGVAGSVTLGDVMPKTFQFVIGKSFASARFQVLEGATLSIIGQCVGTSGNTYTGLPTLISQQGRALQVSGRNPFWCRYTPTGLSTVNLLCFSVKGDVGEPFSSGELCDADRVEYACGTVQ
jgi:hypothetical protein